MRDGSAFQKVFPFSPALVETLVALSQCLQRERTAIRILVEMLCFRLEDFEPGQLVPVGDLFDVLAAGDEPMDLAMQQRFRAAKRLYEFELLPLIQQANGTTDGIRCQRFRDDEPGRGCSNCRERRCRADNRLVKTLLLSALVPEVPTLKDMTARKLVALNHGALPTVIAGNEWSDAVARLRNLAGSNGKVRVGDQADPSVGLTLEGIDLKPILKQARIHDSIPAQQRKAMEIVYQAMGLVEKGPAQALVEHQQEWRGTDRKGSVYFGNVRKMTEEMLEGREGDDFRVVIDSPLDEPGFGPKDDEEVLRVYRDVKKKSAPTIVWLPTFVNEQVQSDLSDLVIIDQLLEAGQLKPYFENRPPEDLQRAETELQNLGGGKRSRVRRALLAAYGLKADENELDPASKPEEQYVLLLPGAKAPGGIPAADFRIGLAEVIRELLDARFPRHARFKEHVTTGKLERALRLFERLCEVENKRLPLVANEAKELGLAESLGLVQIGDAAAVVRPQQFQDWKQTLLQEGENAPTVARLRKLADADGFAGYQKPVLDFTVLAFRTFSHRDLVAADGQAILEAVLGKLSADARVVEVPLPEETVWQKALARAGKLFGSGVGGKACNPGNLNKLVADLAKKRDEAAQARAGHVAALLAQRSAFYQGDPPRLRTARAVETLLAKLATADKVALVRGLADAKVETSLEAMQRHLVDSATIARALDDKMVFQSLDALAALAGNPDAAQVLSEVAKALEADELHVAIAPKLTELGQRALQIVAPKPKPVSSKPNGFVASGVASSLGQLDTERAKITEALKTPGAVLDLQLTWTVRKP